MRLHLMRSHWAALLLVLTAALAGWFVASSTRSVMDRAAEAERTAFDHPPVFIGLFSPSPNSGLKPFAMALHEEGKLLVSYLSSDRIDEFSEKLEPVRTLHLLQGEPASITGLATEGDRIYAVDFKSGDLLFSDYETGKLVQSYGWLPGNKSRMKALGVAYYKNNVYVSDIASRKMLAIGALAERDARDEGELIVGFPNGGASEFELGYPTGSMVTPDGRLLVGDAKSGDIKAFTCNGRSAHLFEKEGEAALQTPMALAMDDVPSPQLQAKTIGGFDPTHVNHLGRVHVVDATQAKVKVFDALGRYVLSYGQELRQPNGIVINQKKRVIFISDARLQAIAVYKY